MTTVPAEIGIRAAAESDLDAVHAIERATFGDPWSLEGFRELLGNSRASVDVAVAPDAEILGYAVAWYVADESEIANLAVAARHRRRGVAARLLDRILGTARAFGARRVFLEVRESNEAARRLYESRGFEIAGRRARYYRAPEEDALIMRCSLPTRTPAPGAETGR